MPDRLVRLSIPLLLYKLLLEPFMVYLAGGLRGSFWSFYDAFLLQKRAITGPVWFLVVLLLFSLLYAARRNWLTALTPWMAKIWALAALVATLLIFGGLELPALGFARAVTAVSSSPLRTAESRLVA